MLDTILSVRGKSKGCIATFIERKTRLYTAIHMPNPTALSMEIAFEVVATQYLSHAFQTATADRGKEFACYTSLEAIHGVQMYFADPYSGNVARMEVPMVSFESFSLRRRISLKSRMKLCT